MHLLHISPQHSNHACFHVLHLSSAKESELASKHSDSDSSEKSAHGRNDAARAASSANRSARRATGASSEAASSQSSDENEASASASSDADNEQPARRQTRSATRAAASDGNAADSDAEMSVGDDVSQSGDSTGADLDDAEMSAEQSDDGDEQQPPPRRGLSNPTGLRCYVNSSVQFLLSVPPLASAIAEAKGDEKLDSEAVRSVLSVAAQLNSPAPSSNSAVDSKQLFDTLVVKRSARIINVDPKRQQDASELLVALLQQLRESPCLGASSVFARGMRSHHLTTTFCSGCKLRSTSKTSKATEAYSLLLPIDSAEYKSRVALESLIFDATKPQMPEGQVCTNPRCSIVSFVERTVTVSGDPKVLMLHIVRFEQRRGPGGDGFEAARNSIRVQIPRELRHSSIANRRLYRLAATLNHLGDSVLAGHYTVAQFSDDAAWRFDDSRVMQLDLALSSESFEKSVYLLAYVRD